VGGHDDRHDLTPDTELIPRHAVGPKRPRAALWRLGPRLRPREGRRLRSGEVCNGQDDGWNQRQQVSWHEAPSSPAGAETASRNSNGVPATCFFVSNALTEGGCYPRAASRPSPPGGGMATSPQGITQLLHAWSRGEEAALEQLIPLIYKDLRH